MKGVALMLLLVTMLLAATASSPASSGQMVVVTSAFDATVFPPGALAAILVGFRLQTRARLPVPQSRGRTLESCQGYRSP